MSKFAVYVVVIEDSESADVALAETVESMERLVGGLDFSQADDAMSEVLDHDFGPVGS